jgi:glycosyltransferase involved in cell wall biosynthesis
MKIVMSYSGGTARGVQLAREFDERGYLQAFYIPSLNEPGLDAQKVHTSPAIRLLRGALRRTAKIRGAKPTERYLVCKAIDRWVERNLKPGTDLLMAESQIALHTLRRAKELGMVTVLDRTNSHIAYQSQVMDEEHARLGIRWKFNSARVIQKGVQEYDEADYILVLSRFVERTFLENNVPQHKVVRVSSGINLGPFRQVEKEDQVFRVIYCGALQCKKGTHYLLQAFSELNLPDVELWLIGDAFEDIQPFLKQYAGQYRLVGRVPNAELYKYYSQGSVFLLPSLEEGLAKVIIEAMACGLPVIATTNTGGEDVIREGLDGFIVPIRDVSALKERIHYLYRNQDLCQQMGQNAKARVHAEFTLERYVERVLHALDRVVKQ